MTKLEKGLNDLETWCLNNGIYGKQILVEWTGVLENGNKLTMQEVHCSSHKKVIWRCKNKHEWVAKINSRTTRKSGCPFCGSKKVSEENNLLTWCKNNGEYGQKLIDEWAGKDINKDKVEMSDFTKGSNKYVWWKCKEGHEWYNMIYARTQLKHNCPYCCNQKASDTNNLLVWCKHNGAFGKRLIDEWVGVDIDGNNIDMIDITYGSGKKVLWKCKENHKWYSEIRSRTSGNKTGCPYCNIQGTSYAEQLIYQSLKELYPNCQNRYKAFNNIEYDIALIDEKIYIEYSPNYTHADKEDRDRLKAQLCIDNNIRFIYISDEFIYDTNYMEYIAIKDNREDMIDKLLGLLHHSLNEINLDKIKDTAYNYSHCSITSKNSLETLYPNLVKEIHPSNNIDIRKLTIGTTVELLWKCRNCKYEWVVSVNNRVNSKSGCPCCGYNWYKAQTGQSQKLKTPKIKPKGKATSLSDFI